MSGDKNHSLFIADLHLDPAVAQTQDLALRFLQFARDHAHLYILGDLFEYWLGDDAGLPQYARFIDALGQLNQSGCAVTVMLGNRDFLLGDRFAATSQVCLTRQDELRIRLGGQSVLLMHGDTVCTDDLEYQSFRAMVRDPNWQAEFLGQSVEQRVATAQAMRSASKNASAAKESAIMDVNEQAVLARLQHSECTTLIHGHTHRPAKHTLASPNDTRWVVGDWHPDHARYVRWDGERLQLETFC